ncbi:hypothetical protein L211DRAFT_313812 [Terfezia boudieri ATCC MYA-4762]|uniref:Uncharacterized protein n=1 Tax=Terfezia boudieri ATCC MYA-4762 TaxID=1051890 RepID=A0A3N4LMA4_9PEZI|nr:hypothetical protein L211DRAFT_313812 [Terfezia boudieri ATCC MYA-4762]
MLSLLHHSTKYRRISIYILNSVRHNAFPFFFFFTPGEVFLSPSFLRNIKARGYLQYPALPCTGDLVPPTSVLGRIPLRTQKSKRLSKAQARSTLALPMLVTIRSDPNCLSIMTTKPWMETPQATASLCGPGLEERHLHVISPRFPQSWA